MAVVQFNFLIYTALFIGNHNDEKLLRYVGSAPAPWLFHDV